MTFTDTLRQIFGPLAHREFWVFMGRNDIKYKYRRTLLGPFWLLFTNAAYIAMLAYIFGSLFKTDDPSYVPYVAIGVLFWNFITQVLRECSTVFVDKKGFLLQTGAFMSPQLVYWIVWRNVLVLLHQVPIIIATLLIFHVIPDWHSILWLVPGLVMMFAALVPAGLIVALLTARLRDLEPLIAMALTVLFFVTPIMWHPDQMGEQSWIVWYNPATYLLELVRAPLLNWPIDLTIYAIAGGMAATLWAAALALYGKYGRRLVFWV